MTKGKKVSRSVVCLATEPNAPFLNGVKMQDQVCETQAEADRLVATGLFAFADADATKGDDDGAASS